jgi:HEAT repeat protein
MSLNDKMVILALAAALSDPDQEVRVNAAYALTQMPSSAKFAGGALAAALVDKNAMIRQHVKSALQSDQVDSATVLPWLVKMLKDPSADVRLMAVEVLYPHGSAGMPYLVAALKDPATEVQLAALKNLDLVPGDLSDALQLLVLLMVTEKEAVRETACRLFPRAGEKGVEHLTKAAKDSSAKVRECVAVTLRTIPPTKSAVAAMIDALQDDAEQVRYHASWTLGVYGPEAKSAVTVLIVSLQKDKATGVRENAAWSLGYLGPDAQSAIPALRAALEDPQQTVRNYAKGALQQLEQMQKK